MSFQMTADEQEKVCWPIVRFARGQLREADYWIAMSEEVGTERLIHEGVPIGPKTKYVMNYAVIELHQQS